MQNNYVPKKARVKRSPFLKGSEREPQWSKVFRGLSLGGLSALSAICGSDLHRTQDWGCHESRDQSH
jgi:hypothetical protein